MINIHDLQSVIKTINAYYPARIATSKHYIYDIYYAKRTKRIYIIIGGSYLFYTDDQFATLNEVQEINNYFDTADASVIDSGHQSLIGITESMDGTVIIVGKDWRKASPTSTTDWNANEVSTVWRKLLTDTTFTRTVMVDPAFTMNRTGSVDSGYVGANHAKIIGFTNYDKIFRYSLDDGLTWLSQDMSAFANDHLHGVYIPKYEYYSAKAKLWFVSGDSADGNAGVFYADTLNGDNTIGGLAWSFRERPGYRLVGIAGTPKRIYAGNESSACGILAIDNNSKAIELNQWEYCLGRNRFDLHQFKSLIATDDGLLFSGTDSYPVSDTFTKSHGGYIYLSQDEGATFIDIAIPVGRWINAATYDGESFWFVANEPAGTPKTKQNLIVFELPKPTTILPTQNYIVKSPFVDSGMGTNNLSLAVGEYSPIVDLANYKELLLSIETHGAGTISIEATPFRTDPYWTNQGDIVGWKEIQRTKFLHAEQKDILISKTHCFNRLFRVKNVGSNPIEIKHLMFIGQR